MTESFASVNGHRVVTATLTVGNGGVWFIDCDLESDPDLSGPVVVKIGDQDFHGSINPTNNGKFGLQTRCRVVGGAGGWTKTITAKDYHNDAGVKARTVAEDAAREVGETIGLFTPKADRLNSDYVRSAGEASRVLSDILGGNAWWVDYAGVTNAGIRPTVEADPSRYQISIYDPRQRVVSMAVFDVGAIQIGSILKTDLAAPQTVRSFELVVDASGMKATAWTGGNDQSVDRLASLLKAVAEQAHSAHLFGIYKYRVYKMNGDRVELQVVRKGTGLPDLVPVSMWPGVAGAHAVLALGAEVLVQFIDGDRTQPIISHFAGKDGHGFAPVSLVLGGLVGPAAARVGDSVQVTMPTDAFATLPGPTTVPVTFPTPTAPGVITSGSTKVSIA